MSGRRIRSEGEHMVFAAAIAARCTPEQMRGRVQAARVVRMRDCAMVALRRAGWGCPAIGRLFGDRDNSSVRSAIARAEARSAKSRGRG